MNTNNKWFLYILANKRNWTLYVWVTSNIIKRIFQHKEKQIKWFTKRYWIDKLVYYEIFDDIVSAIEREKQIKWWNRKNKLKLIENKNPYWKDLYFLIIS